MSEHNGAAPPPQAAAAVTTVVQSDRIASTVSQVVPTVSAYTICRFVSVNE